MSYTPGPIWFGLVKVVEGVEQFHVGARDFDRDHVGVHAGDVGNDIVELRIAHVGVDLRFVSHAVGGDAERFHRPAQIVGPLRFAQWQAFAQRGFVDLDHANAGLFQVSTSARLVVGHE